MSDKHLNRGTILKLVERSLEEERPKEVIERLQWFLHYCDHKSVSELCRHFKIARSTFYRWYERFDESDLSSLEDKPTNLISNRKLLTENDDHLLTTGKGQHSLPAFNLQRHLTTVLVLLFLINIGVLLFALPTLASAASSWNPTLLVNTEAFQVIDDDDEDADVSLRFGDTLDERLTYSRNAMRFEFTRDLRIGGNLSATGSIASSGSIIADGTLSGANLAVMAGADSYIMGDVGIGTSSPNYKLDVQHDGNNEFVANIKSTASSSNGYGLYIDMDTSISSSVRPALRIDNSIETIFEVEAGGKIGIGTSAPQTKLEVKGTMSGHSVHARDLVTASGGIIIEEGNTLRINGVTYTFPPSDGVSSGWVLKTDANGTLSWSAETESISQTEADDRYVNVSGDTMTGALVLDPTTDTTTFFQVKDADGGNPVLNVDTTNERVGIGTATPSYDLSLAGDGTETISIGVERNNYELGNGIDLKIFAGVPGAFVDTGDGGDVYIYGGSKQGSGNDGDVILGHTESAQQGNIGIGTTSPSTKLEVVGTASGNILHAQDELTSSGTLSIEGVATFQNATDSIAGFQIQDTDGGTPILNVDTINERVGIGEASPDQLLDISSSDATNTQLTISNINEGAYNPQIGFELSDNTNTFTIGVDNSDGDKFKISTTGLGVNDRLSIDSSGEISLPNDNQRLTFGSLGDSYLTYQSGEGDTAFIISSSITALTGNSVGIGNTAPQTRLDVAGGITGATLEVLGTTTLGGDVVINGVTYTFPPSDGVSSGWVLKTDAAGTLSWAEDSGGIAEADADNRYVNVSGDTMTGDLILQDSTLTATGVIVTENVTISGALSVGGSAVFQSESDSTTFLQVNDANGGDPVLNIDTTNERVGIGTSSPAKELEVKGDIRIPIGSVLETYTALGGTSTIEPYEVGTTDMNLTVGSATGDINLNTQNSSTPKMKIQSNGYVGIGTTAPDTALSVAGTASGNILHAQDTLSSSGNLIVGGDAESRGTISGAALHVSGETTMSGTVKIQSLTDSKTALQIFDADGGAPVFNVDTVAHRIGIGTDSPTRSLEILGTSLENADMVLQSTGTNHWAQFEIKPAGSGLAYFTYGSSGGNDLQFYSRKTGIGNAMTLDADGNLGIGTNSPSTKLDVAGGITGATLEVTGTTTLGGNLVIGGVTYTFPPSDGVSSGWVLKTDAAGTLSWAAPSATGLTSTGALQTVFDDRYVNTSGDTMTGALTINNEGAEPSLNVTGTMSGEHLYISGTGSLPELYTDSGKVGVGTSNPNGKLHVYTGSSGTSPNSGSDDFVLESNVNAGFSFLVPDANNAEFTFGSASDDKGAYMNWNYNTGIMNIATSKTGAEMQFKSGNAANAMRIDSDGLVGIGTTEPDYKLSVENSTNAVIKGLTTQTSSSSAGANIALYTDDGAAMGLGHRMGAIRFGAAEDASHNLDLSSIIASNTTETWDASGHGSDLRFEVTPKNTTSRIEAMRIDDDGSVGIGTTDPNTKLEVVGTMSGAALNVAGLIEIDTSGTIGRITTTANDLSIQNTAENDVTFFINSAEGETRELLISGYRTGDSKRSLQVGVGTDAADTASFDGVSNYMFDGNIQFKLDDQQLTMGTSGSADYYQTFNGTNAEFYTSGLFDMQNAVKITNTANTYSLDIQNNNSPYHQRLYNTSSGEDWRFHVDSDGDLNFYDGSSIKVALQNGGNVGIGTETPENKLEVAGTISGSILHSQNEITSSGSVIIEEGNTLRINGVTYTFPPSDGVSSGWVLKTDAAGTLSWAEDSGGVSQTEADDRYVNTSGDTMTGDLILQESTLTATGVIITENLTVSGALSIEGNISQNADNAKHFFGAADDASIYYDGSNIRINPREVGESAHFIVDGNSSIITRSASTGFAHQNVAGGVNLFYTNMSAGNGIAGLKTSGGTENVRLSSSGDSYLKGGDVGIGTATPQTTLDVAGGITGATLEVTGTTTLGGNVVINGVTYTFPPSDGVSSGWVLKTDAAGTLSWAEASGGVSQTEADDRYVNTSGDTMTGDLILQESTLTATGVIVTENLTVSGALSIEGNISQNSDNAQLQMGAAGATDYYQTFDGTDAQFYSSGRFNFNGTEMVLQRDVDYLGYRFGESSSKYGVFQWRNGAERVDFATAFNDYPIYMGSSLWIANDTNNGNVGIGTISPDYKLEVNGTIAAYNEGGSSSMFVGSNAAGKTIGQLTTSADTNGYFNIQSFKSQGSTYGDIVLNKLGGNVGIGTTSPSTKLDVKGTMSGHALVVRDTLTLNGVTYTFPPSDGVSSGWVLKTDANGTLSWAEASGGVSQTEADNRYVNTSGDTMTGALNIINEGADISLNVSGAMSGTSLYVSGTGSTPILMTDQMTGRVGIGTDSPGEVLEIVSAANPILKIVDSTWPNAHMKIGMLDSGATAYPGIWFNQAMPSTSNFGFLFDGTNTIFNSPSGNIDFRIGNGNKFRINDTGGVSVGDVYYAVDPGADNFIVEGSVGIGTASPAELLNLSQDAPNNDGVFLKVQETGASGLKGEIHVGSLKSSDGTYSLPGLWLGTSAVTPSFTNYAFMKSGNDTLFNALVGETMTFRIANDSKMIISASGNVGIGDSTPQTKLDVAGGITGATLEVTGTTTLGGDVVINGVTYTFPPSDGVSSGWVLKTDANGTLSWAEASGGVSQTEADNRYVNTSGDTMTGDLILQESTLTATGVIVTENLTVSGALSIEGNISQNADNAKHYFGAAEDASIAYNGSNLIITPDEVGGGVTVFEGNQININSDSTNSATLLLSDEGTTAFRFLSAHQLGGSSYAGFLAGANADGTKLPMRFYTQNAAGADTEALYMYAGSNSDKMIARRLLWFDADNRKLTFGGGTYGDASITYDGTNMVINPKEIGSGRLDVKGTLSGYVLQASGEITSSGSVIIEEGNTLRINGVTYTFPPSDGVSSGWVLKTDAAGTLSWAAPTASGLTSTGALQTVFDDRYVNTSGDTMTGALNVQATMSGSHIRSASGLIVYDGRVGIGTDSPTASLEMKSDGANYVFQIRDSSNNAKMFVDSAGTTLQASSGFGRIDNTAFWGSSGNLWNGGVLTWSSTAAQNGSKDIGLSRGEAGKLYVGNSTQGDYSGTLVATNIGVGTTNPSTALDVKGTASGQKLHFGEHLSGSGTVKFQNIADSTTMFQILDADGGNPMFNVDTTNERVGIGTDSPSYTFDVRVPTGLNSGIQVKNTTDDSYMILSAPSDEQALILFKDGENSRWNMGKTANSNDLKFYNYAAADTTFVLQDSTGNVGIGDTTPDTKLEVAGTISGAHLDVSQNISGSGNLSIEGNTRIEGNLEVAGTISGSTVTSMVWYLDGDISTGTNQGASVIMPFDFVITGIELDVKTAPTGANLIIDINEDGTTIYSTRPEIDATTTTEDGNEVLSDTHLAAGSKVTLDIDQVGSSVAGNGITVLLVGTKEY